MAADGSSEIRLLPGKDLWAFEALKELFASEKGLDLEAYKEKCILRRIYLKVRSKGHSDLGSYYRELRRDRDELERLFQYLTINVTEFFRNPAAFEYLEREVLPDLMVRHDVHGGVGVWSAGCSSGEEPYSLAIILTKVARKLGVKTPVNVLASDVDRSVVDRGREGRYSREALKNLAEEDLREFFTEEDGCFVVGREIRKLVTFRVGNILKDRPGGKQSLIVCRNLLIYFSRENQERIIAGFSRALHQGGYLMLGKAETLIGRSRLHFQSVSPSERIYRLRDAPLSDFSFSAVL
jgi:chemotaxis protein methyltransferase CheR